MKSANNETLQTIKQRRSVRLFTKEEVSHQDISLLLHAANEAASDHNQQSWRFIVSSISSRMRSWIFSGTQGRIHGCGPCGLCSHSWSTTEKTTLGDESSVSGSIGRKGQGGYFQGFSVKEENL